MHNDMNQGGTEAIAAKVDAQRLAMSFLASAISEMFDDSTRQTLKGRLEHWANEAEMQGAEALYTETASLMRLMAARVGEAKARQLSDN